MRNIALSIIPASLLLTKVTAETVIGLNDKNTQLLGVDPARKFSSILAQSVTLGAHHIAEHSSQTV
jgi:hypothetical protein